MELIGFVSTTDTDIDTNTDIDTDKNTDTDTRHRHRHRMYTELIEFVTTAGIHMELVTFRQDFAHSSH